jgi:hypothetical protein
MILQDEILQNAVAVEVALVEIRHQHPPGFFRDSLERETISRVLCERLFAEHIHAAFQRPAREFKMQMVRQQDEDGIDAGSEQRVEVREMSGRVTQPALSGIELFFIPRQNAGDGERRIFAVQRRQICVVKEASRADEAAGQPVRRRRSFFAKAMPARFQFGNGLAERGWQGVFDKFLL